MKQEKKRVIDDILSVNLTSISPLSILPSNAMMLFEGTDHFASIVEIWIFGLNFSCIVKMSSKFLPAYIP
jgi:hypothetical protein